ncbi:MAG: ribose-phosphate diphosphokinase [Thermoplasmatota archaeon]
MKRIIAGSSSPQLATALSDRLGIPLAETTVKRFPDGELYVRVHEELDEAIIIQNTYPDGNIVELFLLQDAARRMGADTIRVVVPYYGYGRQDQVFEPGEAVSAAKLADLIEQDADMVATVDPHKEYISEFFDIQTYVVTAVRELAEHFSGRADMVLAPDHGALQRAKLAAETIDCPYDHLEKTRISGDEVEMQPKKLDAADRRVLIIDDIISTGGTMAAAIRNLKKQGASEVYAACSHGLFTDGAIERIRDAGCDDIVATDTIESSYSQVSAAPPIAALF